MNKKTIVLEFDIRKPKVLSHLGLPVSKGLSNYLLGDVTEAALPVKVPGYDNLFVLPCGPLPPNPAEVLLDPKLDDLFAYLKQNFDLIIMDTAPVGMVSDAMTLSRFADCTLYIVRQGHTYKKQVGLLDQHYRESRLPKLSIVINDVDTSAGSYGSGNAYGYGSGYFEDEAPSRSRMNKWFGWLQMNGSARNYKRTTKV
jgi:tyrosine-protein kinase Etk/Wzc